MLADVLVDGVEVGRIPVTLELDERDHRITLTSKGDAPTTYLLRGRRPGTIVTLDAIAGKLVAFEESTGTWSTLELLTGEGKDLVPVAVHQEGIRSGAP